MTKSLSTHRLGENVTPVEKTSTKQMQHLTLMPVLKTGLK